MESGKIVPTTLVQQLVVLALRSNSSSSDGAAAHVMLGRTNPNSSPNLNPHSIPNINPRSNPSPNLTRCSPTSPARRRSSPSSRPPSGRWLALGLGLGLTLG